jgi:hypothetical protein
MLASVVAIPSGISITKLASNHVAVVRNAANLPFVTPSAYPHGIRGAEALYADIEVTVLNTFMVASALRAVDVGMVKVVVIGDRVASIQ